MFLTFKVRENPLCLVHNFVCSSTFSPQILACRGLLRLSAKSAAGASLGSGCWGGSLLLLSQMLEFLAVGAVHCTPKAARHRHGLRRGPILWGAWPGSGW